MHVGAPTLTQLRAVFGDCVPRENAALLLEQSPAAPQSAAQLQALRAVLIEAAGKKLADLEAAARNGNAGAASSTTSKPTPAATALQLQQVQAARDLQTPDGLKKVLTESEARALFQQLAAMKDIPHHFLEDGCLFRSHVLSKRIEERGLFCEKVFAIPHAGDLVMETPKARLGFTVCWYHEAVCVHVRTQEKRDGRLVERTARWVLDPSMGDAPLTLEAWKRPMAGTGGPDVETFVLPRFAFGLAARDNPPSAYNPRDLEDALAFCRHGWRDAEKSYEEMGFYDGEAQRLAGRI